MDILSIWFLDYHVDLITLNYKKIDWVIDYFLIGIEMGFTILNVFQQTL